MEGHELIKSGAWRPHFGGNGLFTPATMDSDPWIKFESTNFHKYTIALCNDSIFDIVFSLSLSKALRLKESFVHCSKCSKALQ